MKILIYIACFLVMAIIQWEIKKAGVLLGAIPMVILYLATLFAARGLCKLWDSRGKK